MVLTHGPSIAQGGSREGRSLPHSGFKEAGVRGQAHSSPLRAYKGRGKDVTPAPSMASLLRRPLTAALVSGEALDSRPVPGQRACRDPPTSPAPAARGSLHHQPGASQLVVTRHFVAEPGEKDACARRAWPAALLGPLLLGEWGEEALTPGAG